MPALSIADELVLLRRRVEDLEAAIDGAEARAASPGRALVVQTFREATYPTAARSYFACMICSVGGVEAEGRVPSITPTAGVVYVANVGTALPPEGTIVEAAAVGDRIAMGYDG